MSLMLYMNAKAALLHRPLRASAAGSDSCSRGRRRTQKTGACPAASSCASAPSSGSRAWAASMRSSCTVRVRGAACGRWCSSPSEDQMSASAAQSLDAMMNGQTRLRGSREMTDDCYNR